MARESDSSRRRWTEEDEQRARISRHRDFGIPLNYDEATGTCEGEEVCGEEAWMRRSPQESQTSARRYPRMFDPARMEFERSRYRFDEAKGAVGSERGYGYERYPVRREESREQYAGMGRMMHLWEQGPYSGRGPKGYHRSDERIREDVCEILMMDGWVDARDIEVRVDNGDVTLSGSVPDRSMKRLAEDAAIGIPGVRDVHNQLSIGEKGERRPQARQAQTGRERHESQERMSHEPRASEEGRQMPSGQRSTASGAAATSAPSAEPSRFQEGMDVIDVKGNFIGRIKAVRENDFLVDRSMARDLYIPNSTVKSAENQIVLNVDEDQLQSMELPKPDIF